MERTKNRSDKEVIVKGGKYPRSRGLRGSRALRSAVMFLETNFQTATPEQRRELFGTSDYHAFRQTLKKLYTNSFQDLDVRRQLEDMVAKINDHVLRLATAERKEG